MISSLTEFKQDLYRYAKFLVGGGLSLGLNIIITYIFTEFLHFWHMVSFTIAIALEILFLFTYHSLVTFQKRGNFYRFVLVVLFIVGLNWVGVYFLSVILDIHYIIAIILSSGVISIINYILNKKVVFKKIVFKQQTSPPL